MLHRGFLALLVVGLLSFVMIGHAQTAGLGRIDFPTSEKGEAQEHFLRGVLFLHSFEYLDARQEFLEAQKLSPQFVMAYWGEAMTYNEPLWFAQNATAARLALQGLGPTAEARLAKARTDRERSYLEAVHALYGEGTKETRDFSYAAAMERLHQQFPQDDEAAAFYALSLIGTCHRGRDYPVYMQAAAVAESVYERNHEHPGALHYLIHAYDDPIHAPLGLRAARIYAKVAADAAHALHMPSHIFFAMGMWPEAVQSNVDAWAASRRSAVRRKTMLDAGGFHAILWLHYAYLQQGRYLDAADTLKAAEQAAGSEVTGLALYHLVQMRVAQQVETGASYQSTGSTESIDLPPRGADLYAAGISAHQSGKSDVAASALASLKELQRAGGGRSSQSHEHGHGMHESGTQAAGVQNAAVQTPEHRVLAILIHELSAVLLLADGKRSEALAHMKQAIAQEDSLPYEFGPPIPPKPAHELMGEMLLELDQPALARVQFELALRRAPKRALSLLGIAKCDVALGRWKAARESYAVLDAVWRQADPEVREALRVGLARVKD